jgi:hypothetical protein
MYLSIKDVEATGEDRLQPSKENIQHLFYFCGSFFALLDPNPIQRSVPNTDPEPDPQHCSLKYVKLSGYLSNSPLPPSSPSGKTLSFLAFT